ncbi:hypothetical protein EVJ58_g9444 [Rhodofomes roseus]|uniref:Uncharacterized protein n=1 Tax=Rhodofomes roseus TaxID=34475 RepID=A0A4Y9XUM4_9APHY|nr:hypothetical protein EVJ58_g9444 [Rhodofomes roseus]
MPAKRKGTGKTRKVPATPLPDIPQPPAAADNHAGKIFDIHVHSDKEGPKEQPMPAVQAPVARRGKSCLRKADTHNGVIMRYRSDLLALNEVPPSTNVLEKTAPADLLPFFNYLDDWEEAEKTMMAVCSLCDHVDNYHHEEYMKHVKEKGFPNQLVSCKNMQAALEQATAKGPRIIFSQELFEQYLVDFIVAHDQPINIVGNPEF